MAGRRTNIALLAAFAAALVTGILSYAAGTGWGTLVVIAHGVAGLTIVLLAPWKSAIVRRGMKRTRSGRFLSVGLAVLIVVTLGLGVAHSAGWRSLGPVTSMQVHVGAALLALPFAVMHVVRRPQKLRRTDLDRRALLRSGATVGGAALIYGALEGLFEIARLPGSERRFTGSHEIGSHEPARMPVTQWFNDSVPTIDGDAWRLTVEGQTYSVHDLDDFGDALTTTIDCTGGWYAEQEWSGVWLHRLLEPRDARSVSFTSVTGYARMFPTADVEHLLVATRVGGEPLSPGHGYPARLVAPGRRGFWWVKWLDGIALQDRPWWLQSPFPLT